MDVKQMVLDIKTMLGYPIVRLEVGDSQIETLIGRAYRVIKPYITDRKLITFTASHCVDLSEHKVVDIVRIYPTVNMTYSCEQELLFDFQVYRPVGSALDRSVSMVANSVSDDYDVPFRFVDGKVYLSPNTVVGSVTAECLVDTPIEELRDERAISWIQSYSEALVKEVLGRIRGKFKSSNLPVEIDADQLLSEAQSDKDRLESELYDREFGQFFVLR